MRCNAGNAQGNAQTMEEMQSNIKVAEIDSKHKGP